MGACQTLRGSHLQRGKRGRLLKFHTLVFIQHALPSCLSLISPLKRLNVYCFLQLGLPLCLCRTAKDSSDVPQGLSSGVRGGFRQLACSVLFSLLPLLSSDQSYVDAAPLPRGTSSLFNSPATLCMLPSSLRTISMVAWGFVFISFFTPSPSLPPIQHSPGEGHTVLFPCLFLFLIF